MRDRLRDQVVLRLKVRVEAAMGEARAGHDLRHADALHPLAPNRRGGLGEDACPRSLLVVVVVPHWFSAIPARHVSDNATSCQSGPIFEGVTVEMSVMGLT